MDSHKLLLFFIMILYTVFFSYVTILRMHALQTYAYDLGNYNQALHTTLTRKGLLYYTADLLANPSGSLFGVHVSLILLLILPFYAIFPAPESLLVMQSFILALGIFPIYLIAKLKLNSKNSALMFALAYLLNPALQGINWYDFHPESFILFPMLSAMYFSETKRWPLCFLSLVFVMFAMDKAAVLVGAFAFYKLISMKKDELIRRRNLLSSPLVFYSGTIVIAVVWFLISAWLVSVFDPLNLYVSGASQFWSSLGARNVIEIPARVFLHPYSALTAVQFDWVQKSFYVLVLLGSVLFLPLAAPKTLVMLLPWSAISLLSNYSPYYQLGTQYPAYILPAIIYGGIVGASKLVNRLWKPPFLIKLSKQLGFFVLGSTLIFLIISGPLTVGGIAKYPLIDYGFPEMPAQSRFVADFIDMVPKDASILVQNNIFPLVSSRENAYVMPGSVFYPPGTSFLNTLESMLEKVDYILIDSKTGTIDEGIILSQQYVKEKFGLLAFGDGVFLLKRAYSEKPILFEPFVADFNYRDLVLFRGVTMVEDLESQNHIVMFHSGTTDDDFWYGPYVYLPPGRYQATFRLKIEQQVSGEVLTLRVGSFSSTIWGNVIGNNVTGYHLTFSVNQTGIKNVQATQQVYGEDFSPGKYQEFLIDFDVQAFGVYEFIGVDVKTSVGLLLDEVRIFQIEPSCVLDAILRF